MKIISMVCPNCGASIQVDADKKNLTCNYCGNNLYLDDEVQHIQYDNAEETGYQFEKGRQRAQIEHMQQFNSNNQKPSKKRKTWLWVIGWICIFPLPLTILLVRKKTMKPVLKYGLIAAAWIIYLLIGLSGAGNDKNTETNNTGTVAVESSTETASDSGDADEAKKALETIIPIIDPSITVAMIQEEYSEYRPDELNTLIKGDSGDFSVYIKHNPIRITRMDQMDETTAYMELIRENIDYDIMMSNPKWLDRDMYEELYQLICDVVCVPRKTIRIAGEDYPYSLVKSKFLKLNSTHLEYVIGCMKNNTTKVSNIKAYLTTALYNAPNTINHYYTAEVNHDMYGTM